MAPINISVSNNVQSLAHRVVKDAESADNIAAMALSDFTIVILAAGKGTRLRSSLAKVLHRAGGRTLIEHVVRACPALEAARNCCRRRSPSRSGFRRGQTDGRAHTVLQQPQHGTGHAMQVARSALRGAKYAIVLPGDAPLIRTETLAALAQAHKLAQRQDESAAATILSAEVANPSGYGRILRRDDGSVSAIVEDSALNEEQRAINEINSSIYAFTLQKIMACSGSSSSAEQTSRTLFDRRNSVVP